MATFSMLSSDFDRAWHACMFTMATRALRSVALNYAGTISSWPLSLSLPVYVCLVVCLLQQMEGREREGRRKRGI